jgi:hypothetical protein
MAILRAQNESDPFPGVPSPNHEEKLKGFS